jgi:hypothetical protein
MFYKTFYKFTLISASSSDSYAFLSPPSAPPTSSSAAPPACSASIDIEYGFIKNDNIAKKKKKGIKVLLCTSFSHLNQNFLVLSCE